jgi:hypothetical protein
MWEYERKDYKFRWYSELINKLNEMGKEGWEVIYYQEELPEKYANEFSSKVLFKRLKPIQHE